MPASHSQMFSLCHNTFRYERNVFIYTTADLTDPYLDQYGGKIPHGDSIDISLYKYIQLISHFRYIFTVS